MQEEFSEIMNRLSEHARFALQKADFYSKRYNNGYMGTEHLLLGLVSIDRSTAAKLIRDEGATLEEIEKSLNQVAVEVPGADMAMMSLSEAVILTLRMAQNYTHEQGLSVIGTEHILYAMLSQPRGDPYTSGRFGKDPFPWRTEPFCPAYRERKESVPSHASDAVPRASFRG